MDGADTEVWSHSPYERPWLQRDEQILFQDTVTMMKASVDVGTNDMLMNYTHADDMAINGDTPWRGGCEKDPRFFTILLKLQAS